MCDLVRDTVTAIFHRELEPAAPRSLYHLGYQANPAFAVECFKTVLYQ
jgi:hypothetical protein